MAGEYCSKARAVEAITPAHRETGGSTESPCLVAPGRTAQLYFTKYDRSLT